MMIGFNRKALFVVLAAFGFFLAMTAGSLEAQNARTNVQVDTSTTGTAYAPSVSSDGDLSAIAYNDGGSNYAFVVTSDGRGIDWSSPIRVDEDTTAASKYTQWNSVCVVGNSIYVAWEDERNGTSNEDIYFNASHDGGATWAGEQWIDKGYPAGTGATRDWSMVVQGDPAGDHVYILITVDPTTAANEELYLVASHDSGATFNAPVHVPQSIAAGAFDIDYITLGASGMNVHVAWQDDRSGSSSYDDVFYQLSTDGGATWLAADTQINSSPLGTGDAENEVSLAVNGSLVAIGWQEELTSTANEEVRVNVSSDGGLTWNGDLMVGAYDPNTQDVDGGEVGINGANVMVTWRDNRSGGDEVYVAASTDLGLTWGADVQISTSGGGYSRFSLGAVDTLTAAITFTTGDFPNRAECAYSNDGGLTWTTIQTSTVTGDVDYAEIGFNALYNNILSVFLSDDLAATNNVYAGGFRPQTLTPVGTFTAGSLVHFEVGNWPGDEPSFGVLISSSTGSWPLPLADGRETGLLYNAYVRKSMSQIPGVLSGSLAGGVTPDFPFPALVPVGTVLRCIAVGYDPGTTPYTLGAVTDIVEVTVN